MASKHTANYQLNQWEAADKVQRTDFNADNAKIDAALGALASGKADKGTVTALSGQLSGLEGRTLRLATGSYTGTGGTTNTIKLPFPPVFMLIQRQLDLEQQVTIFGDHATSLQSGYKGVYAVPDGTSFTFTRKGNQVELRATGESEDYVAVVVNTLDAPYRYMAIG